MILAHHRPLRGLLPPSPRPLSHTSLRPSGWPGLGPAPRGECHTWSGGGRCQQLSNLLTPGHFKGWGISPSRQTRALGAHYMSSCGWWGLSLSTGTRSMASIFTCPSAGNGRGMSSVGLSRRCGESVRPPTSNPSLTLSRSVVPPPPFPSPLFTPTPVGHRTQLREADLGRRLTDELPTPCSSSCRCHSLAVPAGKAANGLEGTPPSPGVLDGVACYCLAVLRPPPTSTCRQAKHIHIRTQVPSCTSLSSFCPQPSPVGRCFGSSTALRSLFRKRECFTLVLEAS